MSLRFDDFELTLAPLELTRCGQRVAARPQVLQLLVLLASRTGSVVTHAEIRRHLWGSRVVSFAGSVHVCVRQLREALGDTGAAARFIETVPRHGYRFLAPVSVQEDAGDAGRRAPAARRLPRSRLAGAGILAAAAAILVFLLAQAGDPQTAYGRSPAQPAYLRGRYLLDRGDLQSASRSLRFFVEALARDSRHVPSIASLARAYRLLGRIDDSRRYAERAVAVDPDSADAHVQLAIALMEGDADWAAAGRHLERALALEPENVEARHAAGSRFAILGDFRAARAQMDIAVRLDPPSTLLRADYGWLLYLAGDYDAAIERCREALEIDPRHFPSEACLERAAERKNELAVAAAAALRMMELWGADEIERTAISRGPPAARLRAFHEWKLRFYRSYPDRSAIEPADMADAYATLGEYDLALLYLQRAAQAPTPALPLLLLDPVFAPLRTDGRFAAILARLNMPAQPDHG